MFCTAPIIPLRAPPAFLRRLPAPRRGHIISEDPNFPFSVFSFQLFFGQYLSASGEIFRDSEQKGLASDTEPFKQTRCSLIAKLQETHPMPTAQTARLVRRLSTWWGRRLWFGSRL